MNKETMPFSLFSDDDGKKVFKVSSMRLQNSPKTSRELRGGLSKLRIGN